MHQVLASIPVTGIIKPGQIYVLFAEREYGWDLDFIDQLYVITRDEDILPALELELSMLHPHWYELRHFIRCTEVLVDCYEFRFCCWGKSANKDIGYSLFLQRLSTFSEKLGRPGESITLL
jgi:hypothetical protein